MRKGRSEARGFLVYDHWHRRFLKAVQLLEVTEAIVLSAFLAPLSKPWFPIPRSAQRFLPRPRLPGSARAVRVS